ncbi:MAG: glutaredoxin-related protein [Bacteriovoracaceae bacterium]|jgi:glutaredoxin-related protein
MFLGIFAKFIDTDLFLYFLNPASSILCGWVIYKRSAKAVNCAAFLVIDIFLPVFGFIAIGIFLLLEPLYNRIYKNSEIDVYDIPLGEENFNDYTTEKRVLIKGVSEEKIEDELYENYQIQPYLDIFNQEDLDLKLNAIEKLSRSFSNESVQILKKGLDDPSYEVRYFANNALDKIEKKMFSKIDIAADNIKRFPNDYHNYNTRGQLYLDTYFLGILDNSLKDFFLERSLYDFIFSLQVNPKQSHLYLKITQIYLQQEDFNKVLDIADQALENELSEEDRAKIQFYRAEANYNLKNYEKIPEDCESSKKVGILYEKVKESSDWWSES